MPADVGTGTVATFGTSGFTGELLSVDWSGISRESVNTSHMGTTTFHTFIPGDLTDPGELTLEFNFEPDDEPIWDDVEETLTIAFPLEVGQSSPATWAATVFATDVSVTDPLEDKMTMTMTLKATGAITVTAAT